ncbi:autophagy-related protein 16-like isoform X1 [Malaclemys terrapin pileata]|uniref:autophagy-related protein 16-like isoform X1 n=1 Tax=Malaclemys terrapin pileata TaxID=2991368 RepID=UPI0023A8489F|nr:autophagy-related protein 16-like isoform X1 [Malaclemys terrapin pileata]
MEGAGPGPAWRRHVRRELERRERETRRLQGLVQSHEKLLERRDLERLLVEKLQLEPGTQESRAPLELALLQQAVELAELRGAQEELAQSVAHLSDALKRSETECQEQRARAGRCARELAGLAGCCQELQAQLWEQGQEAEGLRAALGAALRARDQLEARWVQEKQLEAQRVNETNAREERYRDQLSRLRQKLERMQLGGTAGQQWGCALGAAHPLGEEEKWMVRDQIQRPDPLLSWTEMPLKWLHQGTPVPGSIGGVSGSRCGQCIPPPIPTRLINLALVCKRCLVLISIFEYALCSFA